MKGTGFVSYVEEGQEVKKGQELIEFWDPTIKKAGLDDTVVVAVTNTQKLGPIALTETSGTEVQAGDNVLQVELQAKSGDKTN